MYPYSVVVNIREYLEKTIPLVSKHVVKNKMSQPYNLCKMNITSCVY